jgi:hypothetical protein
MPTSSPSSSPAVEMPLRGERSTDDAAGIPGAVEMPRAELATDDAVEMPAAAHAHAVSGPGCTPDDAVERWWRCWPQPTRTSPSRGRSRRRPSLPPCAGLRPRPTPPLFARAPPRCLLRAKALRKNVTLYSLSIEEPTVLPVEASSN